MFEVGRICLKIAGRDAGLKCVVIDTIDHNHVLVDGQTRRRKCNVKHLEPTDKVIHIAKNASDADVKVALAKEHIEVRDKKATSKKSVKKPLKSRAKKEAPKKPAKATKKAKSEKSE